MEQMIKSEKGSKKKKRKKKAYTEENSGGVTREGSGYFSSRIPTMTSESGTHLPSNFANGTFPSGLTSNNLPKSSKIHTQPHLINTLFLRLQPKYQIQGKFRDITNWVFRIDWWDAICKELSSPPKLRELYGRKGLQEKKNKSPIAKLTKTETNL